MAYALNIITKEFYDLLDLFRSIRNNIVHKGTNVSLDEPGIKETSELILEYFRRSEKFKDWALPIEGLKENAYQFRWALAFLIAMIEHTTEFLEPLNRKPHSCNPEEYIDKDV